MFVKIIFSFIPSDKANMTDFKVNIITHMNDHHIFLFVNISFTKRYTVYI